MTAKPKQSVKPRIFRHRERNPPARFCQCMKITKVRPTNKMKSVVLKYIFAAPNINDIISDVKKSTGASASEYERHQKGCKIPAVTGRELRKHMILKSLPNLREQVQDNNVTIDKYGDSQKKPKVMHPLNNRVKSQWLPASKRSKDKIIPSSVDKKMKVPVSRDPCTKEDHVSDSPQLRKTMTATGRDIGYMDKALPNRRLKMSPKDCSSSPAPANSQQKQQQSSKAPSERMKCSGGVEPNMLTDTKSDTSAKGIIKSENEILKLVKAKVNLPY